MRDGSGFDLFLGVDVHRLGVAARLMNVSLPPETRLERSGSLRLAEFRVAWALYVSERARFRLEAGVGNLYAPGADSVGPIAGLSFEGCLAGPLDLEARALVTPTPYRQVDATAGLAVHLGAVVLRGGARGLYLDEASILVDGSSHAGGLVGLYLGMGLDF